MKRMLPVRVLIPVAVVLLIFLLLAVDRAVKAIRRGLRRREANRRLTAAAARAEAKDRRRKAAERVSGALTSVMPTIHDIDTRLVGPPAVTGAAVTGPAGHRPADREQP